MTNDAPPGDVPVNIAPPQWQCPHCRTNYHADLASATECTQAGPPDPAPDGVPVLILPSHRSLEGSGPATFGRSKAGPVRVEKGDGGRRHRRDVTVAGVVVDARSLPSTAATDLVVLVNQRDVESGNYPVNIGPSGYGLLDKVFRYDAKGRTQTHAPVWIPMHHGDAVWWRTPNEHERQTLNMLTGNLLDKVAAMDVDTLTTQVRASYRRDDRARRNPTLVPAEAALAVAQAHGAPSHIWALRWLSVHAEDVARWHAQTAIAWAAGTGGPLPLAGALRVSEALPGNPGKKRLALMAPYGTDYYAGAMRALADLLSVDAPSMPVPALGDVVADLRTNRKENHGVH